MTRRTFTKRLRGFDLSKDITGKPILQKRDTLRPAEPPMVFDLDCGTAGIQKMRITPGQSINPYKICKRLGGTFVPPKAPAEKEVDNDADKS